MDNCKIIEDMLPMYCDELTSEESNELIRKHVAECPHCAYILQKMSAEMPCESVDPPVRFRRKLKAYEQKRRIRTLSIFLITVLVLTAVYLLWSNSYELAKMAADQKLDAKGTAVAQNLEFIDGTRSYYVYDLGDECAIVTLKCDKPLKIWYIEEIETTTKEKPIVDKVWFGESDYQWFEGMELTWDEELHLLYAGSNAIAPIEFSENDIPENMLVKVNQKGNCYWIHVITNDEKSFNQLGLHRLLLDKGFITPITNVVGQ